VSNPTDPNTVILAVASIMVAGAAFAIAVATYLRNRKSEQIRIAREIMDKIDSDYRKTFEIDPAKNWPSNGTDDAKREFAYKYLFFWVLW
jgi:hypothetical protein